MGAAAGRLVEVVVAERNPLLRSGFDRVLAEDGRFRLVAAVADGVAFLDEVEQRMPFDVGVIGWEMPGIDGRGVLDALRGRADAPRIIIYTNCPDRDVPRQAMVHGAAAFCSKREPPEQLLDTILQVAAGRMVFPFFDVTRLTSDPFAGLTRR